MPLLPLVVLLSGVALADCKRFVVVDYDFDVPIVRVHWIPRSRLCLVRTVLPYDRSHNSLDKSFD